ncbi:MAG: phosphate acetyltransferase [Clostridiales bacterium]|nr:phosphate acetyltransferase [Clostridiales bacterium]
MSLLQEIREKAKLKNKCIVLAEGEEDRIIRAAEEIVEQKIARLILIGNKDVILSKAQKSLDGVTIIDPKTEDLTEYANLLYELRKAKGMTIEQACELAKKPLYLGVLLVKAGKADGMVAGSVNSTGDTLRPALQIIKTAPGIKTVSSCFIMVLPEGCKYGENGIMVFGDCAVNINPDAQQLADIAIASAQSAASIAGIDPKVAMLSFSTKGSAKHEYVDKVVEATKIVKELAPDLKVDGELQFDAAVVSSVASLKAPGSDIAGHANVMIFPDIQAGNIGYKLVQRLAGAEAVGPICQGFNMPVNDLSRGCSSEDVVNVTAMTVLQCK